MPFISKTYNVNFIELATRIMVGLPVYPAIIQPMDIDYVAPRKLRKGSENVRKPMKSHEKG